MTRFVLLIVLLWVAYELIVRWARNALSSTAEPGGGTARPGGSSRAGDSSSRSSREPEMESQALVQCTVCEVHFPIQDELSEHPEFHYCSDGCRQAAASGPS